MLMLAIDFEKMEKSLGSFFSKIGHFFMKIINSIISAFDKYLPHDITIILLIVLTAFILIYIFTQKLNK